MIDFQTTPLLFVIIVLVVSALIAVAGGWSAISVDPAEDREAQT